eukprot:TRINITY_DN1743_c0_g1_i9.p1 TRINITY_DN1743_c0_g1~~TRINITY_DN1743_c0_g1_i9.p1  ORF type:complete len:294 (-),score=74.31 TRINITY_DN1743_c0_g1_i9:449-1330(-)
MRARVKELLEYDCTEGFEKQRGFLKELVKLMNNDVDVFMKNGGLQLLLPFLESEDVKVQAGVAGVIATLSARSEEYACVLIHEGAAESLIRLCVSRVRPVVKGALGCLANMCKGQENAVAIASHDHLFEVICHILNGVQDLELNQIAAAALANFGSTAGTRPYMRDAGVMAQLIEALENHKGELDMEIQLARGFACMAMERDCQLDVMQSRSADKVLELYSHEAPEVREFAAMALLNIALNGENKQAVLMNDQYLSAINDIAQNCSEHLKKMAVGVSDRLKEEDSTEMNDDVE